jgi:DNA polymerase III delta prime subunit
MNNLLSQYIHEQPHLFVYGDIGTGKHKYVKEFLKLKYSTPNNYKNSVFWLYCFDGKTQDTLIEKIKRIGKQIYKPLSNILHRIIVLDGAEFISYQCQASLRRCIEQFSLQTRFIFIGNDYGNIMKPVQSRCVFVKIYNNPNLDVKKGLGLFGKRNQLQKKDIISLHSLEKTYQRVGKSKIKCVNPYKNEYSNQIKQLKWLKKFIKNKKHHEIDCATEWINQGWSALDCLGWLVWESKNWVAQYDKTIQKMVKEVWKDIDVKQRYNLWKRIVSILNGQQHEVFITSWIFEELRLLLNNNIA